MSLNQFQCDQCGNPMPIEAKSFNELEDLFVEAIQAKPRTITIEEVRKAFDNAMLRF